MLEAMKSLRDEMQSMKKASEVEVDNTSTSLSKAGPSSTHGHRRIWSSTSSKVPSKDPVQPWFQALGSSIRTLGSSI